MCLHRMFPLRDENPRVGVLWIPGALIDADAVQRLLWRGVCPRLEDIRTQPGVTVYPYRLLYFFIIATGFLAMASFALAEEDIDAELVAHVDHHENQALDLLERAVNINSGTMNLEGVREVGDLFRAEFDALGFETEWIDGAPFNRAGHLVANWEAGKPRILLIGHLDTVFEPDSPFQRFERIDGNRAKGPGTIDMKGGNVVMLYALKALKAAGALDEMSVRVILTGDEERRGEPLDLAAKALVDSARWADHAIGFEDGDGDPDTAVVARRGSSNWVLQVAGKPAHSSQVFREDIGYGAIYEAARILDAFRVELATEENLTFNPGVIVGGTEVDVDRSTASGKAFGKNNVIAEHARVDGDLRAVSEEQLSMAVRRMEQIVAANLAHTEAEIEFQHRYPPMAPTPANHRLLELYDQVSRDLGFGPVAAVDPRRAGAADISFTADHVEMAMDGIGLMGSGGHTVEETADLTTFAMQTKRAAVLLYRMSQQLQ